jgi:hypothetical protein
MTTSTINIKTTFFGLDACAFDFKQYNAGTCCSTGLSYWVRVMPRIFKIRIERHSHRKEEMIDHWSVGQAQRAGLLLDKISLEDGRWKLEAGSWKLEQVVWCLSSTA